MEDQNVTPLSAVSAQKTAQVEVVDKTPQNQNNSNENRGNVVLKTIKTLSKRWFIDAFSGMAQGLFVTLIAGTIIKTIGELIGDNSFGRLLVLLGKVAAVLMGAGIGAGIASYLKAPKLVVFASMVAGFMGAYSAQIVGPDFNFAVGSMQSVAAVVGKGLPGNPIGAYVTALMACEIGMLVAGKTKLDILLVPLTCISVALVGLYCSSPFIWVINKLGVGIAHATTITPFFMGIIISVIMGILLTMPTSSAAIWVAIATGATSANQEGMLIAGGAAVVGCACQMVGFAVMSFKENRFSGLISQGLGTSMLQIPNIMRNPRIFIPPIVASAICGPIATCAFKLKCGASGGGMGTCGFVGIIDSYAQSVTNGGMSWWLYTIAILTLFFIIPGLVCWSLGLLLRKVNWIKEGDLSLDYDN